MKKTEKFNKKKKLIMRILQISCAAAMLLGGWASSSTANDSTLLQATFDNTVYAESRDGEGGTLISAALTSRGDGYNGTSGLNVCPGMNETESGSQVLFSPLIYNAADNISPLCGTIDFYVKLVEMPKDNRDFLLLLAGVSDWKTRSSAEWAIESCDNYAFIALARHKGVMQVLFAEYRGHVKYDLTGFMTPDHLHFTIEHSVQWKNGEFHRITASWTDGGKIRHLGIDGKTVAEGRCNFKDPALVPGVLQIAVGGVLRRQQPSFRCVIDNFRVLENGGTRMAN